MSTISAPSQKDITPFPSPCPKIIVFVSDEKNLATPAEMGIDGVFWIYGIIAGYAARIRYKMMMIVKGLPCHAPARYRAWAWRIKSRKRIPIIHAEGPVEDIKSF